MMKFLLRFYLIFFLISNSASAQHFTLSGKLSKGRGVCLDLSYFNSKGKHTHDTCTLLNGTFSFKGEIQGPQIVYLTAYKGRFKLKSDDDPNVAAFFMEPGIITTKGGKYGDLKKIKISGSKTQTENDLLQKRLESFNGKHYEDKLYQYISTHNNSYVSAFNLTLYSTSWSLSSVKLIYDKFSPAVKRSIYGQEIKNEITAADNSTIHKKAIDFSSVDINGKLLRLSDFKGRYVLLDFWASWCIPCRQSTPYLKKLHNKYRKAGLDVIAIADDDNNHDKWRNAINVDKTELWYNILDGKIFANNSIDGSKSISKKYAINILPTRILIDKDGIITGRYSGTESAVELDKKLASIFNHHSN